MLRSSRQDDAGIPAKMVQSECGSVVVVSISLAFADVFLSRNIVLRARCVAKVLVASGESDVRASPSLTAPDGVDGW